MVCKYFYTILVPPSLNKVFTYLLTYLENGVLCTVARSRLLFLNDESEWKNFESNIA